MRYIEDVLPLIELNQVAQKGGGIGSLNAMHPYFARRPLTASRAMTLAALIDAPAADEAARKALLSLLGTRVDLESRAQRWAETHHRAEREEVVQLGLWREGESPNDEP